MPLKQVIVINKELKMGKGKICAQAAHASLQSYIKADKGLRELWLREGAKKVVLKASEEEMLKVAGEAMRNGLNVVIIRDAGLTQVQPNSLTAIAIGPDDEKRLNALTGHLKLL